MEPDLKLRPRVMVKDEQVFCSEVLRTIQAVMKIEHTSLRNAVMEEIVGLLRRASNPSFVAVETDC